MQPPPNRPDTAAPLGAGRRLAWGLLVAWLAYSALMLGWHLASDPLLSTYLCRTR